MLRQANKEEDEPNPFLFKLMDPGRIFVGISTPSAIARIQQPNGAAEDVVDLTVRSALSCRRRCQMCPSKYTLQMRQTMYC